MSTCTHDATLIFPPFMETFRPHLAVPHLTAYLKARGYSVVHADFNMQFWNLCKQRDFLEFLRQQFTKRVYCLKKEGITSKNYDDYFEKNLALAAVSNLLRTTHFPDSYAEMPPFSRKVFALIGGLGFHTLYNNDYRDFLDDVVVFLEAPDVPRDTRVLVRPDSTISQQVSAKEIEDWDRNLYLHLYERFFLKNFRGLNTRLVGISVATNEQVIPGLSLACAVKNCDSKIHTCLGGSYVSHTDDYSRETILHMPFVDSMVLYEGEKPLESLITVLRDGKKLSAVPNLVYFDDGTVKVNSVGEPVRLNQVPPPNYDEITHYFSTERGLSMYSCKGCYWGRCTYCNYVTLTGNPKHIDVKSPEILVEEMEFLHRRYNVMGFNLINEAAAPAYSRKIADLLLERNLKVVLNSWVRIERQFTPELCRKMAAAGFKYLTVGVESLCDRVLEKMDKGYTGDEALRVIRNILHAGMNLQVNVMVGFPTETKEEALYTYDRLNKEIGGEPNVSIAIFPFVLFNNCAIYSRLSEFGLTAQENNPKKGYFFPKNIFVKYEKETGMTMGDVFYIIEKYNNEFGRNAIHSEEQYIPLSAEDTVVWSENVESHFIDFYACGREEIKRSPKYMLFSFDRGALMVSDVDMGRVFHSIQSQQGVLIRDCIGPRSVEEREKTLAALCELEAFGALFRVPALHNRPSSF